MYTRSSSLANPNTTHYDSHISPLEQDARDALFDPLKSTDLPFARKMGVRPIQRSVLYQKMNMLPKNKDGSQLVIDWNDKDQEAGEGKKMFDAFKDDKGHPGLTAHEATFAASREEDQTRFVCNTALKAVRDAQSQMASRKSALQVSVLEARQISMKMKRATKTGKFGSSEQRNTVSARCTLAHATTLVNRRSACRRSAYRQPEHVPSHAMRRTRRRGRWHPTQRTLGHRCVSRPTCGSGDHERFDKSE